MVLFPTIPFVQTVHTQPCVILRPLNGLNNFITFVKCTCTKCHFNQNKNNPDVTSLRNKYIMDEPEDKPGIRALEAMKSLNKTVSIFKIPKIPQKKEDKMKILTEERYIEVWLRKKKVLHS